MEKVKITEISLLGENERGATYELFTRSTKGFLLAYRKAGSISGNHWHQGKSKTKNPEILLLLSGKINLYCKDLETREEKSYELEAPIKAEIFANVLHTVTAITNCSFLEFNSLKEHKEDCKFPS